mgnify:CR=1 FL=1|tara:strand:- start:1172 stop:2191 length:1020 start_codon:yes stop_codon:yes gene_type:complete
MYLNGNKSDCFVYGCGQIFKRHYLNRLTPIFKNLHFIDPILKSKSAQDEIKNLIVSLTGQQNLTFSTNNRTYQHTENDCVFIFTNHRSHFPLLKKSKKSKLIFVEKPCVLTKENWKRINTDIANEQYFWPAYHQFYTNLSNQLNALNLVNVENVRSIRILFYASHLPLRSWGASYTSTRLASGGAFLDLGPHIFSILSLLCKDIEQLPIEYTDVKFSYDSKMSELETSGFAKAKLGEISLEIDFGYIDDNHNPVRSFELVTRCGKILSLDNEIIQWNKSLLSPSFEVSCTLAYKNMLEDSLKHKRPWYFKKIGWNIESIEKLYKFYGKTTLSDDESESY